MPKTAFLFPGQGAQAVGMGKQLYDSLPAARKLFDDAGQVLAYNLAELCFAGPVERLNTTAVSQPDVVVLDLALPDGSGMDAYRAIRGINSQCPVVFITAHGSTETALMAMREGAFDYLIKPVDLDKLTALLERALVVAEPVAARVRVRFQTWSQVQELTV